MTDKKVEYPRMKYSEDATTTVNSAAEEASLTSGKWFDSPVDVPKHAEKADPVTGQIPHAQAHISSAEAITRELPAPIDKDAKEHDRLVFEADSIGLKVDKRWSDERLRREIFEFASA